MIIWQIQTPKVHSRACGQPHLSGVWLKAAMSIQKRNPLEIRCLGPILLAWDATHKSASPCRPIDIRMRQALLNSELVLLYQYLSTHFLSLHIHAELGDY